LRSLSDGQNLVKQLERLMNKNERLDKEVHGLLTTIRDLEREHSSLKDKFAKYDSVLVSFCLRWMVDVRANIDLPLLFLTEMEYW
jgi:predicted nuclease with TOPRIM domain